MVKWNFFNSYNNLVIVYDINKKLILIIKLKPIK